MPTKLLSLGPLTVPFFAALAAAQACSSSDQTSPAAASSASNATASTTTTSASANGGAGGGSTTSGQGGVTAGTGGSGGSGGGMPLSNADCSAPSGATGKLKLTKLPQQFLSPMLAASPRGDDTRMFVAERAGYVQLAKNGQKTEFLDIHNKVRTDGEFGLLGMALHPDYANNGRFFLHYSAAADGATTVEEYRRDPNDPDKADPNPVGAPYLKVAQPASNHDGGSLEFSPKDGFLYLGLGDGGGACDTFKSGQDQNKLLGKILRIDISSNPYKIPPGNMAGGKPEIWDTGMRNPFRFNFDACTGDLYIGDVGQSSYEEIDVEPAGKGNLNYGWNFMEGSHCLDETKTCPQAPTCMKTGFTLPVAEYTHAGGQCSVTGGRVYRGHAIPWLRGKYFYADYCSGRVFSFRWNNGAISDTAEHTADLGTGFGIVAFAEDNKGEMYIINLGNGKLANGIARIDPN